ncbi:signal transducer and activator of transcription 2 isoform X1 [Paramormyrops kingsleyae]|uniref:Signal transducer and activator of transcription n=1 Tax=Paramormyrops kingsleyae TaxID=1676925 RepID=A0A3B3S5J1_9TELE|nr:signal transducer and activator of transcription 1-alpha/beta-like isoform X1 [Paramormyrops kingsleyae]
MSQWDSLQQLDSVYMNKLDELYSHDRFPMDVRHYLSSWIESQNWVGAATDVSLASILFQVLLEKLDNQHSRFVQERDCFVLQRNFRRFKQNFQYRYQEKPHDLAMVMSWLLIKEREILDSAQLAQQVQVLQVHQSPVEMDSQHDIAQQMTKLKNRVQEMEHNVKLLEEQQDEFDFKYQTRMMEGSTSDEEQRQQKNILQVLLNRLNTARKALITAMIEILKLAEELLTVIVNGELVEWHKRQQKSCIGSKEDVDLSYLENWFTMEAECLFQVRKFLKKMEELSGKVTYDNDPFKLKKPTLQRTTDELLVVLLKSAFVVETQPSMPQGKGPLILRTNVQFSVKTRLLVKVPELNHVMKVTVTMDRDAPQVKGYRRFNVLGNSTKALNMIESSSGGMVADFRHLILKEKKNGVGGKGVHEISLSVTEELHTISFQTEFELHGLSVTLQTSSLPVVIISNSSQQQAAWASVLWFNMVSTDPSVRGHMENISFFNNPSPATWSQLADMLSWQFLAATDRGLDPDQLEMIAQKLLGQQLTYSNCPISWTRFSKENMPGSNFSFFIWFDGILVLVKNYLEELWKEGCIMGFVNKDKEKLLLSTKQPGTFLLRFSESARDGGITFSWVEFFQDETPNVRTVQPFTKTDLSQIPFSEIICNFQFLEVLNIPENPLKFLYPNIPRDEAFGKYCKEKKGDENLYRKYRKTKLVFISQENILNGNLDLDSLHDPQSGFPDDDFCDVQIEERFDSLSDKELTCDILKNDLFLVDRDDMDNSLGLAEEDIPPDNHFLNVSRLLAARCSAAPLRHF